MRKRYLSVLLTASLMVTLMTPLSVQGSAYSEAVAESTAICEAIGMVVGTGSGLTPSYLASVPKRYQGAKLIVALRGYLAEAEVYNFQQNFTDYMDLTWVGGRNILGYLKENPSIGYNGKPNGTFAPNDNMTIKEYYKLMLVSLGYTENEDFSWSGSNTMPDVMTLANSIGLNLLKENETFTMEKLCVATVEALRANRKGMDVTLAEWLGEQGAIDASIVTDYAASVNLENAVVFVDAGFEAQIRAYYGFGVGPIYPSVLASKTVLDLGDATIWTLEDLKWFVNLKEINTGYNDSISGNLSSLSGLSNLETIDLSFNEITGDLSSLSGLRYLETLYIDFTSITGELSDLSSMRSLTAISTSYADITGKLSDLSSMSNLTVISFDENVTGDLSDLSSLSNLTTVELRDSKVTGDLSDLSSLSSLTAIAFHDAGYITGNLSSLNDMSDLTYIAIYGTQIKGDLSSLSGLSKLSTLAVSNIFITGSITLSNGKVVTAD